MFITDFPLFSMMCVFYNNIDLLDDFLTDGKQVIKNVDIYSLIYETDKCYNIDITEDLLEENIYENNFVVHTINYNKYYLEIHNNCKTFALHRLYLDIFNGEKYLNITSYFLYKKLIDTLNSEIKEIIEKYSLDNKEEKIFIDKDFMNVDTKNIGTVKEYLGNTIIFTDEFVEIVKSNLTDTYISIFNMENKLSNKSLADKILGL